MLITVNFQLVGVQVVMVDPVIAADDYTYERAVFQDRLYHRAMSPDDVSPLKHTTWRLVKDQAIKLPHLRMIRKGAHHDSRQMLAWASFGQHWLEAGELQIQIGSPYCFAECVVGFKTRCLAILQVLTLNPRAPSRPDPWTGQTEFAVILMISLFQDAMLWRPCHVIEQLHVKLQLCCPDHKHCPIGKTSISTVSAACRTQVSIYIHAYCIVL